MVNGQNSAIRDTLWRTIGYVVGVVVLNVYILDGNWTPVTKNQLER